MPSVPGGSKFLLIVIKFEKSFLARCDLARASASTARWPYRPGFSIPRLKFEGGLHFDQAEFERASPEPRPAILYLLTALFRASGRWSIGRTG